MANKDRNREGSGPFMLLSAPSAGGRARLVKLFAEALGIRVRLAPVCTDAELLTDREEAELAQVDWSAKDVMVGAVRTKEQLRFNLKHRGYYVPARFMPQECLSIRYIALHEQDVDGKEGICRFSRVLSLEKRARGEIPVTMRPGADPTESYWYFTVQKWRQLPRPILIRGTSRGKPIFTNLFLLEHCTGSWQLLAINSPEEYRLLRVMDRAYSELPKAGGYRLDENRRLLVADGYFTVVDGQSEVLEQIAVASIEGNPAAAFCRLRDLLRR